MRLAAASALLLVLLGSSGAAPGPADDVLAALTAADRARATLADAQSRWALDRERQVMLARALEAEARRLERQARTLRERADDLGADGSAAQLEGQIAEREARAERLAAQIVSRMTFMAHRWSPPDAPSGLAGALSLLDAAEQAATEAATAVQAVHDPQIDKTLAVQTLRLGFVAMWWRSLDGRTAGVVDLRDGRRVLRPLDAAGRRAVAAAFAIAGGQQAPRLVDLPLPAP